MRNTRRHRLPWIVAALFTLGGGCGSSDNRVVMEITTAGFSLEGELDQLEVTIVASSDEQGDVRCAPFSQLYTVSSADATDFPVPDFPLRIAVKPGRIFDKILFVRVRGLNSGTVRLKTERMVSLQGGDVQLQLVLPVDCLGVGTGAGQHCVGGLAMDSPYGGVFDDAFATDPCMEE